MIDDERETPINPYQSPRAELDTEECSPGPDRVYGLAKPIRIRGKLSAADVREYYRRTSWDKVKSTFWVFVCLAMVVVVVADWLLRPRVPGPLTVLVVLLVVALLAVWLLVHLGSKRYPEAVERRAVLKEMTFTEEGVLVESKEGKAAFRWSAFSHCQCKDQTVSLYLEDGDNLIYPRRFFAHENDWETFVGLVRCKLPEDATSARKQAAPRRDRLAVEAPGAELNVEAEGRTERGPSILARGALSREDWKEIRRTTSNPWAERVVGTGCFALAVAFFALLAWSMGEGIPSWLNHIIFWGATLLLFVGLVILPPARLRRQWKRQEGPFAPYEVRVWEDGVEFIVPTSRAAIPWSGFTGFTRSEHVLLLHQARNAMVRWIPRSLFSSDEDWETLLRLVRDKLPAG